MDEFNSKLNVIKDTFPSSKLFKEYPQMKFDVITSIAMFYDLDYPLGFAHCIHRSLSEKGVWILEMSYLPDMLATNSFDTICHEHLEYYSFAVLERIFKDADLRCFRIQRNKINGGSIRCWVTHKHNDVATDEWNEEIKQLRKSEFDL